MFMRASIAAFLLLGATALAQQGAENRALDRLPAALLDVRPPSARVTGEPGRMTIRQAPCRTLPAIEARRRIVEVAVQEWGFFGFTIVDHTAVEDDDADGGWPRRRARLSPEQSARVAASIAGYWSITPSGGWILSNQNTVWNGPDGVAARWRYPWSAAFVSWVMCEAGLGSPDQFTRAVAHHTYIDQAIRARALPAARAAFVAYDRGEAAVAPGDLVCTARRPAYRSLADRQRQMGQGARTHCDIVVKVDGPTGQVLAIGGNVRGSVSLKVLPATAFGRSSASERPIFAHLRLRAGATSPESTGPMNVSLSDAFDRSPTLQALNCSAGTPTRPADSRQPGPCALSTDD